MKTSSIRKGQFLTNKGGKPDFLLTYIHEELKNYDEPQREGTPRGEKVGFSLKKFGTSLLVALTSWKLKEIAALTNVSYGLVRKWQTENDFNQGINRHERTFFDAVVDYRSGEAAKGDVPQETYLEPLTQCARHLNPTIIYLLDDYLDKTFKSMEEWRADNTDFKEKVSEGLAERGYGLGEGVHPRDVEEIIKAALKKQPFNPEQRLREMLLGDITQVIEAFHFGKPPGPRASDLIKEVEHAMERISAKDHLPSLDQQHILRVLGNVEKYLKKIDREEVKEAEKKLEEQLQKEAKWKKSNKGLMHHLNRESNRTYRAWKKREEKLRKPDTEMLKIVGSFFT